MAPAPFATLLGQRWFVVAATTLLALPWWISGIAKLLNLNSALAEARHFGLEPTWLVVLATIMVQIGGSVLLILGRWAWLGAGALCVFTAIATLIAHPFWTVADPVTRFHERNTFLEHAGLIGGLMLAAIIAGKRESAT